MTKLLKYLFHLDYWLIAIFAFVILWLLYAAVSGLSLFSPVKRAMSVMSITDVFFKITSKTSEVNQDITIIDIKDEYNRGNIVERISAIDSFRPWIIGVDIIFESVKGEAEDNYNLFQTVSNIISNTVRLDYVSTNQSFINQSRSFFIDSLVVESGFTNLNDNLDNTTMRKMWTKEALNDYNVHSFPEAVAMSLDDSIASKPTSKLSIDYSTRFTTVANDSIDNNKDLIKDHIELIGSTIDEPGLWHTPKGKMPVVMVLAYSLNTIRNHSDIKDFSKWTNLWIAFCLFCLFEVLVNLGFQRLRRRNSVFGHFLIDFKLLLRVATIVVIAIVAWIIAQVFVCHSKYIDALLFLATLVILIERRRIYNTALKALSKKHNWCILKNSLLISI